MIHDEPPVRHILSLSGGKDSTALAIYLRDRVPNLEYVFCDTGEELPETYGYLDRIAAYLGKDIKRLKAKSYAFQDLLKARNGFLPSPNARWCTQYLKIQPFEEEIGESTAISYIAIRADESHRKGYISTKPNITARYPFIEDGIVKADVMRLLEESGLGLPDYYRWRTRSGCYFCFFQQRIEWVGLLENHPGLFQKAAGYEKEDPTTGERYTWNGRESLAELARPERVAAIKHEAQARKARQARFRPDELLMNLLVDTEPDDDEAGSCLICHL